jgi:hypothetical protein
MSALRDAAERYAYELGWAVIPVIGKRPRVEWKKLPDFQTIKMIFDDPQTTGVAVILGEPSMNLVVRDFDRPDAFERWRAQHADLAAMLPTAKTGFGFHVYARTAAPSKTMCFDDGELRGNGTYVVAPPSKHPSGSVYCWLIDPYREIPIVEPEILIDGAKARAKRSGQKVSDSCQHHGFTHATALPEVNYTHATAPATASFTHATAAAGFTHATVLGGADYTHATAPAKAGFTHATAPATAGFTHATALAEADYTHATALPPASFTHATAQPTPPTPHMACVKLDQETLINAAIEQTVPLKPGRRNHCIFLFARRLRMVSPATTDPETLRPFVQAWYRSALPNIGTKEFAVTWRDFVIAWRNVEKSPGACLEAVKRQAAADPETLELGDSNREKVAKLMRSAARTQGGDFFMDYRTMGGCVGLSAMAARSIALYLVNAGLLMVVEKGTVGSRGRATVWRWLGS